MFRKTFFLGIIMVFAMASIALAGHYEKHNSSIYLDGKVHIRFDTLHVGWAKDGKKIDKIRYRITCLAGKAILNNVEYLDSAVDGKESLRWAQSNTKMGVDFSAIPSHLEKSHIVRVYRDLHVNIAPYQIESAKIRFHIQASGRDYKINWEPKSGKIWATW